LFEALIALALSAVVVIGMVLLMGNSMGTANRITQSAQLNDQLRNVMSMMTRDVRRANYSAASVLCYGNPYCSRQDWTLQEGGDALAEEADNPDYMIVQADPPCLLFQLDRAFVNSAEEEEIDGNANNDPKGGFRLEGYPNPRIPEDTVGVIEMWVGDDESPASAPTCGDDRGGGWVPVSDPNVVNIVDFRVDDSLSVEKSIFQDGGEEELTQRQRYLVLAVEGELVLERVRWVAGVNDQMTRRRIEDVIAVRNDYLRPPPEEEAP
jgi:hypothetical protein